jgi:hypothetical protein
MSKKFLLCIFGIVLGATLMISFPESQAQEPGPPAPPPARKIPGITVNDSHPRACVDCHINYVEMKMDTRFSTLMNQWNQAVEPGLLAKAQASAPKGIVLRGKHPKADGVVASIPEKCLACHSKSATISPPFAGMIHNIHLVGGDNNHFLTMFQGECTLCHKLDLSTGFWRIPSAPEI